MCTRERRSVRTRLQGAPWDLYASIGYSVVAAVGLPMFGGSFASFPLIFFVPGYLVVSALFPGNKEIDWIERIALALGLSIAVETLLGLVLNFTQWGIRFVSIVVAISGFSLGVGGIAYVRRMRLPADLRFFAKLHLSMPKWTTHGTVERGLTIALAPRPSQTFTEFYILGSGGNASGYPSAMKASETGTVILGIVNHESARINYTIRIDLVGVRIVYSPTLGLNETVEVNRTTLSTLGVTLVDGENWTRPYPFSIPYVGLWQVQLLLFKSEGSLSPYRELHIYVTVS